MRDVKMREAFEAYRSTRGNPQYCSEGCFSAGWKTREALAQPSQVVELTDEECLIVIHAATSKVLPEDEQVPLEDLLSSYRLKLRGASALLSGLRAVIAAHEAKRSQS